MTQEIWPAAPGKSGRAGEAVLDRTPTHNIVFASHNPCSVLKLDGASLKQLVVILKLPSGRQVLCSGRLAQAGVLFVSQGVTGFSRDEFFYATGGHDLSAHVYALRRKGLAIHRKFLFINGLRKRIYWLEEDVEVEFLNVPNRR